MAGLLDKLEADLIAKGTSKAAVESQRLATKFGVGGDKGGLRSRLLETTLTAHSLVWALFVILIFQEVPHAASRLGPGTRRRRPPRDARGCPSTQLVPSSNTHARDATVPRATTRAARRP